MKTARCRKPICLGILLAAVGAATAAEPPAFDAQRIADDFEAAQPTDDFPQQKLLMEGVLPADRFEWRIRTVSHEKSFYAGIPAVTLLPRTCTACSKNLRDRSGCSTAKTKSIPSILTLTCFGSPFTGESMSSKGSAGPLAVRFQPNPSSSEDTVMPLSGKRSMLGRSTASIV